MQRATERLEIELFCPQCGQKLLIPSHDLSQAYQCPRCRSVEVAHNLVTLDRPIAALPVGPAPSRPHASRLAPTVDADDEGTLIGTAPLAQTPSVLKPPTTPWTTPSPPADTSGTRIRIAPRARSGTEPTLPAVGSPPGPSTIPWAPSSVDPGGTMIGTPPLTQTPSTTPMWRPQTSRPSGTGLAPLPDSASPLATSAWPGAEGVQVPPPTPSDPTPASSGTRDRRAAALAAAREGMRWTGRALLAVAAAASWFDATTYGRRQKIVAALAIALVVTQIWTAVSDSATVESAVGTVLMVVLLAYAIARVQDFRDEDRRFTMRVALGNLWALARFLTRRDPSQADEEPPPGRRLARICLSLGVSLLATRSLLVLLGGTWRWVSGDKTPLLNDLTDIALIAWIPFLYAIYVFTAEWRRRLFGTGDDERGPGPEPKASREILSTDVQRLPHALDLVGPNASGVAAVDAIQDPVLRKLVTALPRWRPGQSRYEAEYQAALGRFLRRHLRGHTIEEQFPLKDLDQDSRPRRRRIDFVIDGTIALELKPRLERADTGQRAVGQVREYAEMWRERGPVLLLIVETPTGFEKSFAARQLAIRDASAAATMVVAAGRRVEA